MERRAHVLLIVLVLTALVIACGSAAPTATPTPTVAPKTTPTAVAAQTGAPVAATAVPPTATKPAATPVPPTATTAAAKPAATATPADSLSLSNRETGLDKLKSYRLHWTAHWKSTDAGKTESSSWDWLEEYTANPPIVHTVWLTPQEDEQRMEWWKTPDAFYFSTTGADGSTQCTMMSEEGKSEDVQQGLFSPSLLGAVQGAKYMGTEDVNGVRAKRYRYDESTATVAGVGKVSGEIWVAVDGGFVVRETATWKGSAGLFGTGAPTSSGEGTWTWELSDVNKPLTIKVPDSCQSQAASLPIMKDATGKATMGDIITYKTASKVADVAAFYEKEMAAAGYELEESQDMGPLRMLQFAKGDEAVSVMITVEGGQTQVVITLKK